MNLGRLCFFCFLVCVRTCAWKLTFCLQFWRELLLECFNSLPWILISWFKKKKRLSQLMKAWCNESKHPDPDFQLHWVGLYKLCISSLHSSSQLVHLFLLCTSKTANSHKTLNCVEDYCHPPTCLQKNSLSKSYNLLTSWKQIVEGHYQFCNAVQSWWRPQIFLKDIFSIITNFPLTFMSGE